MSQFIRIKHYIINLEVVTYVRVDKEHIDFGFAFPTEKPGGQNFVRLERGLASTTRSSRRCGNSS